MIRFPVAALTICVCLVVLLFTAGEAWSLPTCPGSPQTDGFVKNWHNCKGTYISTVDQYLGDGPKVAGFPGGSKYVGEWQNNMPNGHGTQTWADGTKYVGEWRNDAANGQGTLTYADGRVKEGVFKN